jgi:hypothetical protein
MKFTEIERVQSLLTQALGVAMHSMSTDPSTTEAKGHIRQAINKLDTAKRSQIRKKGMVKNQFEQWWGNIQAGTSHIAMGSMSAEAQQKSLQQLNKLIAQEEQKMAELEKAANREVSDDLLID